MPLSRPALRVVATVATAVLAIAPSSWGRRSGASAKKDDVAARVDALVTAYQRRTGTPGVSVAVIRAGRDTLVYRGYGVADVANDVAATPRTVYPISSNTKQFTAAAVMQLVEQGRVGLDDPIGRHLPGLPAAWRPIPVRQWLNHTSGVPDASVLLPYELSPDSVVAHAGGKPLDFAPGTQWKYSNVGYVVLGLLIEKVSGETYGHYLDTHLFRPAGLTQTRFCDGERIVKHRAAGYEMHDTTLVNAAYVDISVPFSAGALCSTAGDLARWNRALATGRVVSPASYARMTMPEGASTGYGYGLIVMELDGHRMVGHGGEIAGIRSSNAYLPDDSLSVTVLTNLESDDPGELSLDIARAALGIARPASSGSAAAR